MTSDEDYPEFWGEDRECGLCGGLGTYAYCQEDCCPVIGGEDCCDDPACQVRCAECGGKGHYD